MALQWPELNLDLCDQVVHGTYVSIVAPEYGSAGERLWALLDQVSGLRPALDWSDEPPWHMHGALELEADECALCGAPIHHRGRYCSKACEEVDTAAY
ncbi:hypothetical protein [Streptomyces sp. NRRL S-15]|uniref:hypothetical protein n=1 Tax=Streptomyces sp. NRRL S-15 TaxID=1463886 RepID=UPI0004CB6D56|nr:hypothetical protein [Streptomyces sp. NRRL S-15]